MTVNTDIWGAPTDWVSNSTYALAEGKQGAAGHTSYYNLWTNEHLDLNTIDISIAFWGISKDSIWAQPQFLSPYWDGEAIQVDSRPVYDDPKDLPAIFACNQGYAQNAINYNNRYTDVAAAPYNNGTTGINLLSFNYQKMVIVPCVLYVSSVSGTRTIAATSLKDYIDNIGTTYNSYRYVVGFGYRVYVGDPNRQQIYGLRLQGLHSFAGSDIYYQPSGTKYTYFATEDGFDEIVTGDYIGASNQISEIVPYSSIYGAYIDQTIGDADTGYRAKYCVNYNAGGMLYNTVTLYWYDPDEPLWSVNAIWEGYPTWQQVFAYINVTDDKIDDFKAYVLKQIAYLGFIFAYDPTVAVSGELGDTGLYYPVFDNNGITTGDYKDGIDAARLPNSEWIDAREGAGYDPSVTPEGDLDNSSLAKVFYYSSNKYYVMIQSQLDTFLNTVNGLYTGGATPEDKAEAIQDMQIDFKGSNPSDYIVGLYGVPMDITQWGTTSGPVVLGPVEIMDISASVQIIDMSYMLYPVLRFGTINKIPGFDDFRDYSPYTTLELYVPYCGTVQLDPAMYIGHGITVEGLLDLQTGEMCVRVLRDGITVTNTVTGNIYVSLPVTSQAMGSYANNIHQLQMAAFNRSLNTLTGAVTGGASISAAAAASDAGTGGATGGISPAAPISMASNLISLPVTMADYDYRITHAQPVISYTSACSPANNVQFYRKAKLFVKRPVMLSSYSTAETKVAYAHTVGHACSIIGTIADSGISGFCQIGSIDLSGIPATVEEIQAIKQALGKGVYV